MAEHSAATRPEQRALTDPTVSSNGDADPRSQRSRGSPLTPLTTVYRMCSRPVEFKGTHDGPHVPVREAREVRSGSDGA